MPLDHPAVRLLIMLCVLAAVIVPCGEPASAGCCERDLPALTQHRRSPGSDAIVAVPAVSPFAGLSGPSHASPSRVPPSSDTAAAARISHLLI